MASNCSQSDVRYTRYIKYKGFHLDDKAKEGKRLVGVDRRDAQLPIDAVLHEE
jgi:hypothetical protein